MKSPLAITALLPTITLLGCKPTQPSPKTVPRLTGTELTIQGPNRPGYTVNITYSPKSLAELTRRHETVIVASSFSAQPAPNTPKALVSDIGDLNLGGVDLEVPPRPARPYPRRPPGPHHLRPHRRPRPRAPHQRLLRPQILPRQPSLLLHLPGSPHPHPQHHHPYRLQAHR